MLEEDLNQLVGYLEEMIESGVQLIYGGQLIDWSDTKILELIKNIRSQQQESEQSFLAPGDLLQNRASGQKVGVILDDGKKVHLSPIEKTLVYPKEKLWLHFRKTSAGESL